VTPLAQAPPATERCCQWLEKSRALLLPGRVTQSSSSFCHAFLGKPLLGSRGSPASGCSNGALFPFRSSHGCPQQNRRGCGKRPILSWDRLCRSVNRPRAPCTHFPNSQGSCTSLPPLAFGFCSAWCGREALAKQGKLVSLSSLLSSEAPQRGGPLSDKTCSPVPAGTHTLCWWSKAKRCSFCWRS